MEEKSKTYKTELIVATITALSAISVAIISNWSDIWGKKDEDTQKEMDIAKDSSNEKNFKTLEYGKIIGAYHLPNDYDMELFQISTIQVDSTLCIFHRLSDETKYRFYFDTQNPATVLNLQFYSTAFDTLLDPMKGSKDFFLDFDTGPYSFDQILISVDEQKLPETISITVGSE